ncbi:retrovirus-related pol polyprotein from transposon tnt 1-94 [Lasius niger]|uniref:Retrovirus-related pol polyprotein from transposon tnt 1-94 n=1 Tax=Lasius niger TaxID=67767 RepID=A0A0J7K2V9_LASNI|nr:retrovirus-related pol polyprotein from transposon tnt 1-94 [Lasius niger]
MTGYSDADWGKCTIDRKSYTGYSFILSGAAVSWKAQKQRTVALSSTEAEYMALAETAKEAAYLRTLLRELGDSGFSEITVFCDNRGAQILTENPAFHVRTKHIDIRHHYVRQAVKTAC